MKKALVLVLVGIILFTSISFAGNQYEQEAERLKEIGVFKGTGNGFELERAPTRLEGAIMFVRLLGGGAEAKEKNYSHPFEDVPAWGSYYVGYLYHNGLTKGISSTEFGSSGIMVAKSYLTFMLRALNYDDSAGDFSWSQAVEKAREIGLVTEHLFSELKADELLRDHVAVISFNALKQNKKGTTISLARKLVEDGAFTEAAAISMGVIAEQKKKELSTEELVEKVKNATVSITTSHASGSGFIIEPDGKIITNYHVIERSDWIEVTLYDGRVFNVDNIYYYDKARDIAMLSINANNLPTVKLGNSDKIRAGQDVVVIGDPLGLSMSVSRGIVSHTKRWFAGQRSIQIDAAVSPGNSGGPVFNKKAEVIGVVHATWGEGETLGLVIPINDVKPHLDTNLNIEVAKQWDNFVPVGLEYVVYDNGDIFHGHVIDGVRHGWASVVHGDNSGGIAGEYKEGQLHGIVFAWDAVGNVGLRGFNQGKPMDEYVLFYEANVITADRMCLFNLEFIDANYVGEVLLGQPHGWGVMEFINCQYGSVFCIGEFKNGSLHGMGMYLWGDGTKFIGVWENGDWTENGEWFNSDWTIQE